MLSSIDCMHWRWKTARWLGQGNIPTTNVNPPSCLKSWLDMICGFGIVFFGLLGSVSDIKVLQQSHLFTQLASGKAPAWNYMVNDHDYTMGYYLADGVYPSWSIFVKTIIHPKSKKHNFFAEAQEAYLKDIERAFRVLQTRFAIVQGPACFWDNKIPLKYHDCLCNFTKYDRRE